MTYKGAIRCYRANMARAATLLERAKDEPDKYEQWYALACRAEELARGWLAEAERLKSEIN